MATRETAWHAEREAVVVKAMRPYQAGQSVLLNDPRPNCEQILATGALQEDNMSDHLLYEAFLVPTDKLYTAKREVLRASDLQARFLRTFAALHAVAERLFGPRCCWCGDSAVAALLMLGRSMHEP